MVLDSLVKIIRVLSYIHDVNVFDNCLHAANIYILIQVWLLRPFHTPDALGQETSFMQHHCEHCESIKIIHQKRHHRLSYINLSIQIMMVPDSSINLLTYNSFLVLR